MNFIDEHKAILSTDHYLRSSQLDNEWVYFSHHKLGEYHKKTKGDFCLVISGKHALADDFHAVPFDFVKDMFTEATLCDSKSGCRRWNCWIEGHTLKTKGMARDIQRFFANREVLGYLSPSISEEATSSIEGARLIRLHVLRERSRSLSAKKKAAAIKILGTLQCEVCSFDFATYYGKELGEGFLECHHRKPLAQVDMPSKTSLEDLALVCSNCHSMLHRSKCETKVETLADIVNRRRTQAQLLP